MKKSKEALFIANLIDIGDLDFVPDECYLTMMGKISNGCEIFWNNQHRIIALCFYAAILQDEGL